MATNSNLVRIEDPVTRQYVTVSRATAERAGAKILDRPATDRFGVPLPPLPRTDKAGNAEAAPEQASSTKRKDASHG